MEFRKLNQRNIILLVVLAVALVSLFGGFLVKYFADPTNEELKQVLEEKGPKLKVEAPLAGATVKNEFDITGVAKTPDQYIRATLIDPQKKVLDRQTTRMKLNLDWTKFKLHMEYKGNYRGKAELEVYWLSNKDGSRQDVTKIPVNLE